ncbi:MAG: 7-cyano-7-deazaguanine synthase [Promethearchaeota archaeon]|jgi:7-cyano-7-deazaguanine synthase
MKKLLVITGANGYLGKHTIKIAVLREWYVIGIVRREEAAKEVEELGAKAVILEDFNRESLEEVIENCRAIIHFRGVVCGPKEIFDNINIEGMRVVVNAAKEKRVSRIIFISGLGVDQYGKADWATNEYFRSKIEAERILQESTIPYTIFRPTYILGPNDELIPDLIDQIGNGTVLITGSGDIPMQPIFVKDAINGFLAAAEIQGQESNIFDLVGLKTSNMLEIVDLIVNSMRSLGFNVPSPRIQYVSYDNAPDQIEICKERIDVMRCDVISNGNLAADALGFKLSGLNEAVEAAVAAKMIPEGLQINKKAIILLSGGIDSTTALYWAIKKGYNLIVLSFNYHLRPEKERKATLNLTAQWGIEVIEVPVEYMREAIDLRIEGFPVPSATYSPEGFIPTRNLVFYSIAAYYAEVYGCNFIIGGHIASDTRKFPDADVNFFTLLENLIKKGKHQKDKSSIKILLPLINKTKTDVVKLAIDLNVPLEWTWSCYSDGEKPCGECSSCVKRKNAFDALRLPDSKFSL